MKGNREDLLRRVLIRPASQIGLEDESIPYSNQYTGSEEEFSYEPVDNNGILEELRQVSKLLTQITESLARLEEICTEIATSSPSLKNARTVSPDKGRRKQDEAHQLLVDLLTDNPEGVEVQRIMSEAEIRGISMKTMRRVKQKLGVKSKKRGTSWWWKWPDSQ